MIVALDLSTSGLGMVAGPPSWDLQWKRIRFTTLAYPLRKNATPREQTDRLRALASDVCTWCERMGATEVWAEQQPGYVPSYTLHSYKKNAELVGVVRVMLADRLGLHVDFVDETTVRKLLLGWVPAKDRKAHVVEVLKAAGDPFFDDDQRDGFTVLNWRFHALGAPCLTGLLGEKPARPKKKKRSRTLGQAALAIAGVGG